MTSPQQSPQHPELWQQLQWVAEVVMQVRSGVSGTAALTSVPMALRPGVQSLVFAVLRNLGRAEALRASLAPRKPAPAADALLCSALALVWREEDAPYEVFTLVNQAVEAAKQAPVMRAQASFINACLRRFLRERSTLVQASDKQALAQWNHPAWWILRLQADHPAQWQAILKANNQQPPMTLRVNVRKTSQASYLQRLQAAGIAAQVNGEVGITLDKAVGVRSLPEFDAGWVSVQDAAAQMAAPMLISGLPAGARVLDACAAPGGKTAHLLELLDCEVTALDIDPERCQRIDETLQRLGLNAQIMAADAAKPKHWWDGRLYDAILLDAPCTASGIVRRHPDVRWLRRETDVAQLTQVQAKLLKTLWPLLKPGGRLLYCTCSVFKAEGELQIQTFLAHNTQARLRPSPGHLLPKNNTDGDAVTDNQGIDHDGFYYALLEKSTA